MELTPDQQKAFDAYEKEKIIFISGPAGTGKSFLIHYIQKDCEKKNIPYITLSSTGISAHHIGGMTVHGFLCRLKLKLIQITPDTVFILDEISMLGKKVYDSFEYQLRKYFSFEYFDPKDKSNPFGGAQVVLFGDFAQLPPINDSYCFDSEAWDYIMSHHELTTIKRQNEPEFKTFLSHIRTGKLLREDKEKIEELKKHNFPVTTHLFLSNKEAEEFNQTGLHNLVHLEKKQVSIMPSIINAEHFTEEEKDNFFQDRHQCYKTLTLCEGAKCMLTSNIDVANGWCNGTLGTIASITEKEIVMKNEKGECFPIARKTYTRYKCRTECDVVLFGSEKKGKRYCGKTDCLHSPVWTYVDDDFEKDKKENALVMIVDQFPIILAWGLTIHKSQGMTLSSCCITLPFIYSPSLIYVAFSRCTSFESLCIRTQSPIRYDQICPSAEVMTNNFGWNEKTCKICNETYLGPYASFCKDCCSAPGKYSFYRFIDFIQEANPSPDMIQYVEYAKKNPTKGNTTRWKKFVTFCNSKFMK